MNMEVREWVGMEGKGEGGTMQAPRSSRFALVWVDPSGGPLDLWPTRPFPLNPPLSLAWKFEGVSSWRARERKPIAGVVPLLRELDPNLTQCRLGRGSYTSLPSDILIHPAVWPQQTWAENGVCAPLEEELGPHLTQCGQGRGLPPYQVAS